jgi:hypothetical protein
MTIFYIFFPNGKAVSALKQGNSEANGAIKASFLMREGTRVTHVAQEGKLRAKTGLNTQTNSTSVHRASKSGYSNLTNKKRRTRGWTELIGGKSKF